MRTNIKEISKALLHFIYPPFCLHCRVSLSTDFNILCQSCLSLMEWIDPENRCLLCFSLAPLNRQRYCPICQKNPPLWQRSFAALEYAGPAKTLLNATKYGNQPFLTRAQAAFMVLQLIKMNISFPDLIVPLPLHFEQWLYRGYNENLLLAHHFGKMLARPVYRAKGLSLKLYKNHFEDKNIFLVGGMMTKAFKGVAKKLWETYPKKICVFTFCC